MPCSTSAGWFDAATSCYLTLAPDAPTLGDDPTKGDPTYRKYRCARVVDVVGGRPLTEPVVLAVIRRVGSPVDPRVAARAVVARMTLRAVRIGMVPRAGRDGHVGVPVWMWVDDPGRQTTGPYAVTETEQGLSITATATLDRIEWDMGDGVVVNCGLGTPYEPSEAIAESPDCGHIYGTTSAAERGGRFAVTATSYWSVHWEGGGAEGDIDLNLSSTTARRIGELRPVLVAPDR